MTHAAGQTSAYLLQVVGHPRPLAQLHNHWLVIRQTPKGVPIGAQAVAQHVSVAPVILGAGHGEAAAEPIDTPRRKSPSPAFSSSSASTNLSSVIASSRSSRLLQVEVLQLHLSRTTDDYLNHAAALHCGSTRKFHHQRGR